MNLAIDYSQKYAQRSESAAAADLKKEKVNQYIVFF